MNPLQLKLILLHFHLLSLHYLASVRAFSIPRTTSHHKIISSFSSSSSSNSNDSMTSNNNNEDNSNTIHWAIVGLGDVCAIKSGPAFYKCHGSTLSAVMRRTPGAARQWIENNANLLPSDVVQSIRAFDSVEQMMQDFSSDKNNQILDAVYVASPPGAHLENVRQIIKATTATKIKAVYVEKPCGRCAWETRAMVDELQNANIELYPAYVSRAHERTGVLCRLLGVDKVCGEEVTRIKYTQRGSSFARGLDKDDESDDSVPWRLNAKYSGGGLIMDMGCHILDRIDYLFGPLENVNSTVLCKGGRALAGQSSSSYPLVEDYVAMSATVGECDWSAISSVGATVECLWDFSPRESSHDNDNNSGQNEDVDELIISGPNGSLRMGGMGAGLPIEVLDSSGHLIKTFEFDAPMHAAQPLIQSVVNELLGSQGGLESDEKNHLVRCPARADNAVRTSEVLDAILGSYYGGRHDDFWSRRESWPGLKAPS